MPKISDAQRAKRREQILEAAWCCFQHRGLSATTMEDIVREAGVSAGSVYLYFASKDELVLAAVDRSLGGLEQELAPLLQDRTTQPLDQLLESMLAALLRFAGHERFDLLRIALHGWSEAQHNAGLAELMRGHYTRFRKSLASTLARRAEFAASPEDAAQLLLSLLLGFIAQRGVLADTDPAALVRGLRAALLGD
ncbi:MULTISPECIES: TetR/AcrR family transcriptional regulator [unclassified Pseudomonas]|uniref:TetR/AcrR family transcriptional regulator n=1 Tax=unclassified Pseudomonas TaxID=196821 RepID=UPI00073031A7|nr:MULTISPECIES: TetR/AcrR family transcriptional regulator [unclassified Pseudomonas]KSW25810.1 hypothetical protein AOX63_19255 [Pseudomonas sp. ADP]OBP12327.1 hypothetical protein BAE52_04975 [Pseudomonas sp. EGD-AKN5]QOF82411.1 TetR/AcrR family transcriptional regulator [Pseudomonas sp. ADPe]GLU42117.1 TetR family transcriptional regulator [Pseudomonas sp. NBRC 100443]